jgi:ribosomal protein S24E
MEIKILEEKENLFLKRKEIKAEVHHINLPTPKKDEIINELAKKYSVDNSQVIVDYIFTKKGTNCSIIKAKILTEVPKEKMEKVEEKGEKVETQTSENK